MSRLPSWVIVAAVGIVLVLAAADALRPHDEVAARSSGAELPVGLQGVLVIAGPDCSTTALRLPSLETERPPIHADCNGTVWSRDGTLAARCTETRGTEILTERLELTARVSGCAPAWREDGALSVVDDGNLRLWRRHGRSVVFLSRRQLADQLEGRLENARSYRLTEIAWRGTVAFAAVISGEQPWQRAVIAYAPEGVNDIVPELGQDISGLRVSPAGSYVAFARETASREIVMLDPSGRDLPLPRIGNALDVAWSPDERFVAISTRTTTFIARTGTRDIVQQIAVGGVSLAWLS